MKSKVQAGLIEEFKKMEKAATKPAV